MSRWDKQLIDQEIMKRNNTLNIRHLVDELFVPSTQRIILKMVGFIISFRFKEI